MSGLSGWEKSNVVCYCMSLERCSEAMPGRALYAVVKCFMFAPRKQEVIREFKQKNDLIRFEFQKDILIVRMR